MPILTGDSAPAFDLVVTGDERVRLSDFVGRANLLLVFHPYAFTEVCAEEALDMQANIESFRAANTEIVFVSCDAPPARQAWKRELGVEYTFASDFWPHGAASRAYDVFDEATGSPLRGTFLIDTTGTVIWSLFTGLERRTELVSGSLDAVSETR